MSNERKLKRHGFPDAGDCGRTALLSLCMESGDGLVFPYQTKEHGFAAIAAAVQAKAQEIAATGDFAPGFGGMYVTQAMAAARDEYDRQEIGLFLIHPKAPPGMMRYTDKGEVVLTPQGMGTLAAWAVLEDADGRTPLAEAMERMDERAATYRTNVCERDGHCPDAVLTAFASAGRLEIARHYQGTGQAEGVA